MKWLFLSILFLSAVMPSNVMSAVVITENVDGETALHIFDNGIYYMIEYGQLQARLNSRTDQILMINHEFNVYYEGKIDDMLKGASVTLKNAFEKQFADMPADVREQMQAMMRSIDQRSREGKVTHQKGDTTTIAGHKTEKHTILVNDKVYSEIWVSDAVYTMIKKEFDPEYLRRWQRQFLEAIITQTREMGGLDKAPDPIADVYNPIVANAWSMKIQPAADADMLSTSVPESTADDLLEKKEVTSVEEKKDFNPNQYSVPEGYRKADSWNEYLSLEFQDEDDDEDDDW
jgi:hypothetical protein